MMLTNEVIFKGQLIDAATVQRNFTSWILSKSLTAASLQCDRRNPAVAPDCFHGILHVSIGRITYLSLSH